MIYLSYDTRVRQARRPASGKPYGATWKEIQQRFGYNQHRRHLLDGFKAAMDNLKAAGCRKAYLDGGFITASESPKDWDACWELEGVDIERVDRIIIDADFFPDHMKEKYFGDLFLNAPRVPGGNFLNFFQRDRDGRRKGIIAIDLEAWE